MATELRQSNQLISSKNRLKFGVFGVNVSGGCSMTDLPEVLQVEWSESVRIAQAAEAAGIEAIIPVARWKGMGGKINFNHRNFETFTWAAGLAAVTSKITIFATVHVPTVHPVRATKEVATIDHISGGRFALNLVAGWNEDEMQMFGISQLPHDERYEFADEWLSMCKELWTKPGQFDWQGKYFSSPGLYSEPKPVQRPNPVLMSAGNSERGQHFAARHTDLNFVVGGDIESIGTIARNVKKLANETYGRDIQVFGQAYIVCRDSEEEALAYRDRYVNELGDWEGVENLLNVLVPNSQSALGDGWRSMASNLIAGYGAVPLVGTPDQVAAGMSAFAEAGLDGISLSWVDYHFGLQQYNDVLRPLLIKNGLRSS